MVLNKLTIQGQYPCDTWYYSGHGNRPARLPKATENSGGLFFILLNILMVIYLGMGIDRSVLVGDWILILNKANW